jgi:hypothetical protein
MTVYLCEYVQSEWLNRDFHKRELEEIVRSMASRFTGLEPSQFFRMGLPIKLVYPSPVDTMDKVHVRVENVARTIVKFSEYIVGFPNSSSR